MNDRYKNILFLLLLVVFLLPVKINAEGICPAKTLSKYESEAFKVKITYETAKDYYNETKFRFTVTNLSKNIKIVFNNKTYNGGGRETIEINGLYEDNQEYQFKIYSSDSLKLCGDAYLTTKKVKIPKYNIYSELQECIEYEEFPICQKFYQGEIDGYFNFIEQLEALKEASKSQEEEYKDERTLIQKIIDWCSDNIEITVAIISVIVIIIVAFIVLKIRKHIKRVKIKL